MNCRWGLLPICRPGKTVPTAAHFIRLSWPCRSSSPSIILRTVDESVRLQIAGTSIRHQCPNLLSSDVAGNRECLDACYRSRTDVAAPSSMSALPPKADIAESDWHVRFVPKADICPGPRVRPAYRPGTDCLDWIPAY